MVGRMKKIIVENNLFCTLTHQWFEQIVVLRSQILTTRAILIKTFEKQLMHF